MHQVMSGVVGLVAVLGLTLGLGLWRWWSQGRTTKGKRE